VIERSFRARGPLAFGVLAVGAAVAQAFGRFTYGVLLPAIRDDLGISNTVAGSLATVNVAAYLVGTLAVASATSRYRLLAVLRVGFVLAASGLVLSAISDSAWTLAVGLFLSGLGGACIWIPSPVIAADSLSGRRSLAVGLMGSGIGVGVVFTAQLSGGVRSSLGDEAWRTVYGVQAAVALVVLVAVVGLIGHDQARPPRGRSIGGFSVLRRMQGWIPLTAAYTVFGLMYLLVIAFLTTRLEDDSGWSGARASLAFTMLGLAVVVGGPTLIAIAEHVGTRRALMLAFGVWSGLALMVLPGWLAPALAASVGLGLLFAGIPSTITLYVVEHTSVDAYGPSFAAATLAFGVAQMVAPQLGGLIADVSGSFTLVFVLSATLAVVGLLASSRLPPAGSS
jgi:predicted MFS family arabinose efflux permease